MTHCLRQVVISSNILRMFFTKKQTITALHEQFCAEKLILRKFSPKTISWYRDGLKALQNYKSVTYLSELNDEVMRGFFIWGQTIIEGKKDKAWSSATSLAYYNSLSSFFSWCVKTEHIRVNPLENVPRAKQHDHTPKSLSTEEVDKILYAVQIMPFASNQKPVEFYRYRNLAILAVFLGTGIRRQELLNIDLSHLYMDKNQIFILKGKGGKNRFVTLSDRIKYHLESYLRFRDIEMNPSPYLFCSHGSIKPMSVSALRRMCDTVKRISSVSFGIHQLRHTFVSHMAGHMEPHDLIRETGHSSIKMINRYHTPVKQRVLNAQNQNPLGI